MPDLDILIEMSDFYDVELRELLSGERKGEKMDPELKETVLKVAEFTNEEKKKITKWMHILFIIATVLAIVGIILTFIDVQGFWGGFFQGVCHGTTLQMMIVGCIITSKNAAKFKRFCMK